MNSAKVDNQYTARHIGGGSQLRAAQPSLSGRQTHPRSALSNSAEN
jgi:hypothetical protein